MCYILSTTKHARWGKRGGDSPPLSGSEAVPQRKFLVLKFRWVVRVHGFVHGFAHGFGVRWFSAPGIFVDPIKGTTIMF